MSVDVFKGNELVEIASLGGAVEKFNREQHSDTPLFAEVVFYRGGEKVASLTDALTFDGSADSGELRFEVEVNG